MAAGDQLSNVPPDEFVKARDALASQLRAAGDKEGARRIAARRRPSAALWIVNQLGGRARERVDQLIDSTQQARRAQVEGRAGDELREAMRSQREAMHRLLDEAELVAAGAGLALTLEQQRRIQDTLETAASTDPDALREGTLQRELSPAGFDALLSGPAAIAPKARPASVAPKAGVAAVASKAGVAAVASKAATQKQAFEARAQEQKRLLQERRDRVLRQREIQRAQLVAQRLAGRAEQLEKLAERTRDAAEKARSKAEEARRAANEASARLSELRTNP
ncbi:MAG TPA: hypothetical protein VII08_10615 [Myxococcales bacterium]